MNVFIICLRTKQVEWVEQAEGEAGSADAFEGRPIIFI